MYRGIWQNHLELLRLKDRLLQNLQQQLMQTYHETVYKYFAKMISRLIHLRQYDKKVKQKWHSDLMQMNIIAEKNDSYPKAASQPNQFSFRKN